MGKFIIMWRRVVINLSMSTFVAMLGAVMLSRLVWMSKASILRYGLETGCEHSPVSLRIRCWEEKGLVSELMCFGGIRNMHFFRNFSRGCSSVAERLFRIQKVGGSIPSISNFWFLAYFPGILHASIQPRKFGLSLFVLFQISHQGNLEYPYLLFLIDRAQ